MMFSSDRDIRSRILPLCQLVLGWIFSKFGEFGFLGIYNFTLLVSEEDKTLTELGVNGSY